MHALIARQRTVTAAESVGVIAAAFGVLLGSMWWGPVGLLPAAALVPAAWAAVVDVRHGRLPDWWVIAAALPTGLVVLAEWAVGHGPDVVWAVTAGAGLLALPLLVAHLVSPAALGFGDVKLGAALGGAVGLVDPTVALLALVVASGATATVGLARRSPVLPLGPGLVIGAAAALLVAGRLGGTPLPWR